MATRPVHMVIDALDPPRLAAFWSGALAWDLQPDPEEPAVLPARFSYPDPSALPLVFIPVPERKVVKNRVHLDLASASAEHQQSQVRRLIGLGATRADIGQGDVAWEVLADPEGNEFCVLDPRPQYARTGPVAAVVTDCADPAAVASFWGEVSGWQPGKADTGFASLGPPGGTGPYLEFVRTPDPKSVKNRLHVDVAPPPGGDHRAEADRLRAAGAVSADVGQGDVRWVVLADPEGNEFCVLSPR